MAPTHLSHALLGLLARREISATQLAKETKLTQSTISRACTSAHQRLDVPSLFALCSKQADRRDGLEILLAHLRDEVERAGRTQVELSISAAGESPHDDLAVLAREMREGNEELVALIHDMAQLARSLRKKYPERNEKPNTGLMTDDSPTAYGDAASRQTEAERIASELAQEAARRKAQKTGAPGRARRP